MSAAPVAVPVAATAVSSLCRDTHERLEPHPAAVSEEGFHPAWGTCFVPAENTKSVQEDQLGCRLQVFDEWFDAVNTEGGITPTLQHHVWTAMNHLVGTAAALIDRNRPEVLQAESALRSIAAWYQFEDHSSATLRSLGQTIRSAVDALTALLQTQSQPVRRTQPGDQHVWQRLSGSATAFI